MNKERGRPDATETGAEKPSIFEQFLPQQHKKLEERPKEGDSHSDDRESLDFRQFLPGSRSETAADAEAQSVAITPPGVKVPDRPTVASEGIIAPPHESRRGGLDILDEAAITEPLQGETAILHLQEQVEQLMGAAGAEELADE
jgi:hypothetical protein